VLGPARKLSEVATEAVPVAPLFEVLPLLLELLPLVLLELLPKFR
jgi:hypothetical protein